MRECVDAINHMILMTKSNFDSHRVLDLQFQRCLLLYTNVYLMEIVLSYAMRNYIKSGFGSFFSCTDIQF